MGCLLYTSPGGSLRAILRVYHATRQVGEAAWRDRISICHCELPVSAEPLLPTDHELDGAIGFQICAHPHSPRPPRPNPLPRTRERGYPLAPLRGEGWG